MNDERFSNREIDLKFEVIKNLLVQIAEDLKTSNLVSEKRFVQLEEELNLLKKEVEELKTFKTRTLAYWSIGLTIITIGINKFL